MLQDSDTSITLLSKTIEKDQSMVMKLLRLVNSAFYGFRSKIENLPNAILLLGFNTVRNAVVSLSILGAFSKTESLQGFDINYFWRHSIAVAVASKHMAEASKIEMPDNCFVGGLLHDIGKIILSQYVKDLFEKIWCTAKAENLPFSESEKKIAPIGHALIGGYLAKRWQLPPGLTDAIRRHHTFSRKVSNPNLLMIVHTANSIVNTHHDPGPGMCGDAAIHPDAAKALAVQLESSPRWYPQLAEQIQEACDFFNLEKTSEVR